MKNNIYLLRLVLIPYLILALITVHRNIYYRPTIYTQTFNKFMFVFTITLYVIVGLLLGSFHEIPDFVFSMKKAKIIIILNIVILFTLWGENFFGYKVSFLPIVPELYSVSLLLGYYFCLSILSFKKR